MAITTVNARYEGFIFDGQNSRNYGVYVTDVEVFGAPVRNVEMIQIPGRNGAYALDNGFYENIQVTYKCAMGCESQADFNAGISAFRNMLASRIGYKRLEDEINADEYRMACFHGGISVPTLNKDTATFDVVFDCKPQRFLKSGETAVTIGGDVTNPQTKSGSIVSIESDGGDKVTSLVAQIKPIQAGSGNPSPTNVRAITGWTAAAVNVAGKNLLGNSLTSQTKNGVTAIVRDDGSFVLNGTASAQSDFIFYAATSVTQGFKGSFVMNGIEGGSGSTYSMGARIRNTATNANRYVFAYNGDKEVATSDDEVINRVYVSVYRNTTVDNVIIKPMLRLATETDATYEPYKGTTYPVSFGSAGTVYGGTVDVVTGVLTVTHKMIDMGAYTWSYYAAQDVFYHTFADKAKGVMNCFSDIYAAKNIGTLSDFQMRGESNNGQILFKDSRFEKTSGTKSDLSGHTCVYELATPQTYNLTAQQVELLTGQNHVWADTGDITLTYGRDPNKLVNPTLYNAHPLLSFTASGAGTIQINSDTISVTNQPIGDIVLANVVKLNSGESVTWSDTSRYLTGDAIRIDSIPAIQTTVIMDSYSYANYTQYSGDDMDYLSTTSTSRGMVITHSIPTPPQYVAGTSKSDTYTATVINKVKNKSTGTIVDCTINISVQIAFDGTNHITATNTVTTSIGTASTAVTINTVIVNSTKSSLNGTAYIDLDIGEAYAIDGGAVVSINDSVSIGAALPVLGVGSNTVSKTGSVANLKVTPRWWQL